MHCSEGYVSQTLLKKETIDSWQVELKRKQIKLLSYLVTK